MFNFIPKKFKLNSGPPSKLTSGISSARPSSKTVPFVRFVFNDAVSIWKMSMVSSLMHVTYC